MSPSPSRFSSFRWWIIPALALGFVVWINVLKIQRVKSTTALFEEPQRHDAKSPTGFAGGTRELIVPQRNSATYHLIAQTQQMLARSEARVRHVDYDNAPFGRAVNASAPPRWWLGLVAEAYAFLTSRPLNAAVESAALFSDPLLHVIILLLGTVWVARRFGAWPAALFAAGVAALFPFSALFAPGAPDDEALAQLCAMASLLLLLGSFASRLRNPAQPAVRSMIASGVVGGLGLWVSVGTMMPVLIGISIGGLIAASFRKRLLPPASGTPEYWRLWGLSGAVTVLATYFLEFFPGFLGSWELKSTHPLYGLAWWGLAEWLHFSNHVPTPGKTPSRLARIIFVALATLAVAALPIVMAKTQSEGFLAVTPASFRLNKLPGAVFETSLTSWFNHQGLSVSLLLTLCPGILIVVAIWLLLRRGTPTTARSAIAVALGAVLASFVLACWRLNQWSLFDGCSLALLVAMMGGLQLEPTLRAARGGLIALMTAILVVGAAIQVKVVAGQTKEVLSNAELTGMIDRDLAHWLAKYTTTANPIVLAPPQETTALFYYGGLRGLGTLAWENQDGISAAVRLASASTAEEAKELIDRRSINYIVVPSWDAYLDQYARIGTGQIDATFIGGLHAWRLPNWLKPVAYQVPTLKGFEGQSVKVLEVVDDQDDAVALSRLAEYFLEMDQVDQAASVGQALRRFPSDLGALTARAQVELARNDAAAFGSIVELLRTRVAAGGDRGLLWDRRASLAVVLARAKLNDPARTQVQRCLTEIDEARLRSLSPGALYRLEVLLRAFRLSINDARLNELALDLLPPDLRAHLSR